MERKEKKKRKKITSLFIVVFLLVSFQTAIFAVGSQEESDFKKEVSIIHFMNPNIEMGDANDKAFAYAIDEYKKNHPDITVSDEFIQHDNYQAKLKTMIASLMLSNVYYSKPDLFPLLRENNLIMPLTDMINSDPEFKKLFNTEAFSDFNFDGEIWALPFQLQSNHVIYYHKNMLKEAGYDDFPSTMDEFKDLCIKLRANGHIPVALGNKGRWLNPSCIFNTMVYRFTDAEWFYSVYNNNGAKFTDKPFVDAAKLMSELVELGAFNEDMNSIDKDQQRQLFYNEEAAMFIEGSWALGPVIENMDSSKVGLSVLPPVSGYEEYGNIVAGGAGWGICVNPNMSDEQKELVFEFVKEVYGQEYGNASAKNGGFPAVFPELDPSSLDPLVSAYNEIDFKFAPIFDVQFPGTIVDVFYNDMQQLLIGIISPEEYAENIEAAR
jgi:raffinose/stachyose/melibiose transport system substrate-binding protein